jgi:hypothetical protein
VKNTFLLKSVNELLCFIFSSKTDSKRTTYEISSIATDGIMPIDTGSGVLPEQYHTQ